MTSVTNALRLLEEMAHKSLTGVSELSRSLQISKTSVDRLLSTLVAAGFVEQEATSRRYRLTQKVVTLAEHVRSRMSLVDLARPHLAVLAEQVQEAVNLGAFSAGSLVYLDTIPSAHTFQIEVRRGSRLPAYCTGAGKAILAHSRPTIVRTYLGELSPVAHTPLTLRTPVSIREELAEIRRQGFAIDRGEFLAEVWCAAAPVLDRDGYAIAAVSVTAPKSRFTTKDAELAAHVMATAHRITTVLTTVSAERRVGQ